MVTSGVRILLGLGLIVAADAFLGMTGGAAYAGSSLPCTASVTSEPLSAGLSHLSISSSCRAGEKVRVHYEAAEFARLLDARGNLSFDFDCFLGDKPPVVVAFEDGTTAQTTLRTLDLDRVTKVAVSWRGAVNLDLHAFEYAAGMTDPGHVWAQSPSTRWEVEERMRRDKRGHGFISFISDGGTDGDQVEVYTFVHDNAQAGGAITLALDYESRAHNPQDPDTCGTGLYAELEYKVMIWHANGRVAKSRGVFSPIECNRVPDQNARYSSKAMPQLFLTR